LCGEEALRISQSGYWPKARESTEVVALAGRRITHRSLLTTMLIAECSPLLQQRDLPAMICRMLRRAHQHESSVVRLPRDLLTQLRLSHARDRLDQLLMPSP